MTHAPHADLRTGTASPTAAAAAAMVAVLAVTAAIALTQPLPALQIDLGVEAAQNDAAVAEAARAWEAERKQQMVAGGVSASVLESAAAWEARYHQVTPAAAIDIRGELHSEYLIELFGADDAQPSRFGPPGR